MFFEHLHFDLLSNEGTSIFNYTWQFCMSQELCHDQPGLCKTLEEFLISSHAKSDSYNLEMSVSGFMKFFRTDTNLVFQRWLSGACFSLVALALFLVFCFVVLDALCDVLSNAGSELIYWPAHFNTSYLVVVSMFNKVSCSFSSGQQWNDNLPYHVADNFFEWSDELTRLT